MNETDPRAKADEDLWADLERMVMAARPAGWRDIPFWTHLDELLERHRGLSRTA